MRPAVARCGVWFDFACSKRWADLTPTADPTVRHCDGCGKPVHLNVSRVEVRRHALGGRCVAVDTRLVDPGDAWPEVDEMLVGDIDLGLPRTLGPPPPEPPPRRRGPGRYRRP